ncbi:hypothetical protein AB0B74_30675 [Micromonospora parva]|uniref:hypothetical protein n=1 Tax=Micromonospora parva TaxID=1464048 RepID=UPI0033FD34C2
MFVESITSQGEGPAAWIGAIGQALGALFTAAAVVVALCLASKESRDRKREDFGRSLAQAKLVRVGGPGLVAPNERHGRNEYRTEFKIENYSDRPILDLHIELWTGQTKRTERPNMAVHSDVWKREQAEFLRLSAGEQEPAVTAWRVRWTDADGRQWCIDKAGTDPYPYAGEAPRPY